MERQVDFRLYHISYETTKASANVRSCMIAGIWLLQSFLLSSGSFTSISSFVTYSCYIYSLWHVTCLQSFAVPFSPLFLNPWDSGYFSIRSFPRGTAIAVTPARYSLMLCTFCRDMNKASTRILSRHIDLVFQRCFTPDNHQSFPLLL